MEIEKEIKTLKEKNEILLIHNTNLELTIKQLGHDFYNFRSDIKRELEDFKTYLSTKKGLAKKLLRK